MVNVNNHASRDISEIFTRALNKRPVHKLWKTTIGTMLPSSCAHLLARDEARRIAVNIAKLTGPRAPRCIEEPLAMTDVYRPVTGDTSRVQFGV